MAGPIDALGLSQALIRCPSVTPADAGALGVLEGALASMGFKCHRMVFSAPSTPDVDNLYARLGTAGPNFCYAGHTDVVPPGDVAAWTVDPFAATIRDGMLYGRGAADMKASIAAFAAAVDRFLRTRGRDFGGSISFLITGDEEGPAVNGTVKVLDWMKQKGETIDACLVGEPTNPEAIGDMAKIGRRGSLNAHLTVEGVQGHSAYPEIADNPIPRLMKMLTAINDHPLDPGSAHFPPSTVAITSVDVGNPATNVIPPRAEARFNVRFNDNHTGATLAKLLDDRCKAVGGRYALDVKVSGEAFLTPPGRLSDIVADAVHAATGRRPELSTTGGTSDARFIKDHCPICEFGAINATAHKIDERIAVADIEKLVDIYTGVLDRYFAKA